MTRKCSICGAEYKTKEFIIGGRKVGEMEIPACNCEFQKYEKEQKQRELEKKIQQIKDKTDILKKELNCPLMSPLFQIKTFEHIVEINKTINSEYEKNLNRCIEYAKEFNKDSKGLFMIGNVGTGKTTLQACIIHELEKRGKICLLINFSTLLDLCIQSCSFDAKQSIFQILNTLSKFDYVVLDDIGREKYTDKRLEFAFRVVDSLMNYNVTVSLTANPECFQKLGKIEEYKAIIDRLRFMCPEQMVFNNESFRGAL